MPALALTVFISSPSDVGQERLEALRVLKQLEAEFGGAVALQPIRWEDCPLEATRDFASQIPRPSDADIVICIFWSRLGTRLPQEYQPQEGVPPPSGTEYEFEDAYRASREHGKPALLVYLKTAQLLHVSRDAKALQERAEQMQSLDQFFDRWFRHPDASLKSAFHPFENLDEFADLLTTHLRQKIQERLTEVGRGRDLPQVQITWRKGSPYRGLEVFDAEHAPIFFGRTRAIGEIKEILNSRAADRCSFLLVFGMSGCGKSSLVRAGVLPSITQPGVIEGIGLWRSCLFLPSRAQARSAAGADLFAGMAAALRGPQALPELGTSIVDATEFAALLREAPRRAPALIAAALKVAAAAEAKRRGLTRPPETRLVVVVDQMEELFTQEGGSEREGFIAVLSELARSGVVWVIATMRSDFFHRCEEIPELIALKKERGTYHLLSPGPAEIRQMICEPAKAAGLRFEQDRESGIGLDDMLHEAAGRNPEALPLLEFTLDELFKKSENGLLTFAAYRHLGGLEGALAQRADELLASMEEAVQQALPEMLRALVTVEDGEGRQAVARRVPRQDPARTPACEALMEAFIKARLLVTDRADDGQAVVRVAHEALLHHWPRVHRWLERDLEFLRARDRVADDALVWREQKKSEDYLLQTGKPLTDALALLSERRADLDRGLVEYIEESRGKATRSRRRRTGLVTLAFAGVLVFGVTSYSLWLRAEYERRLTVQAIASSTQDTRNISEALTGVPQNISLPLLAAVYETNLGLLNKIPETWSTKRASAAIHQLLAQIRRRQGLLQQAFLECQECVAIGGDLARQTRHAVDERNLAWYYDTFADVLRDQGEDEKALAAYGRSLSIRLELAKGKNNLGAQRDLWYGYMKIARYQDDSNRTEEAAASYKQALMVAQNLAKDKSNSRAPLDLAASWEGMGEILEQRGQPYDALAAYEKSLGLLQGVPKGTRDARTEKNLSEITEKVADLRQEVGREGRAPTVHKNRPVVSGAGRG